MLHICNGFTSWYVCSVSVTSCEVYLNRQSHDGQMLKIRSPTLRSVSLRGVQLRAELVNFGFLKIFQKIDKWILDSLADISIF